MNASSRDSRSWLAALREIAPVPDGFPHRRLNWDVVDPGGLTRHDFRAVFDVYDTHQFSVEPARGDETRWITLAGPDSESHEFSSYARPWPPIGDQWEIVGVSRSAEPEWATADVPDVPVQARAWASFNRSYLRTTGQMMRATSDGDAEVTLVVSQQRPEVWVLAMSAAEVIARYLTASTGCPWIDNPPPGEPGWTPHDDIRVTDDDELSDPELPESHGRWVRGSEPLDVQPADIEPPAVDVLRRSALDGEPLPDESQNDKRDIESLVALVDPPARGVRTPDWKAVEAALGGPVRDDVKMLLDTYGAGTFGDGDDDSDWPITGELRWLPAEFVEVVDDTALSLFDVQDLLGDRSADDLRAVVWATIDANHEDELWLWRVGDRHGIARNADDHVRRLPGTAARNLNDALLGRGLFGDLQRDTDLAAHPLTFTPR